MGPAPIHSRGRVEVRWGRVMDLRVVAFAIVAIVAIVGGVCRHMCAGLARLRIIICGVGNASLQSTIKPIGRESMDALFR
eukprot:COSAG03_NODE_14320_length_468_cov_1.135501_1_plen_80_part_00